MKGIEIRRQGLLKSNPNLFAIEIANKERSFVLIKGRWLGVYLHSSLSEEDIAPLNLYTLDEVYKWDYTEQDESLTSIKDIAWSICGSKWIY